MSFGSDSAILLITALIIGNLAFNFSNVKAPPKNRLYLFQSDPSIITNPNSRKLGIINGSDLVYLWWSLNISLMWSGPVINKKGLCMKFVKIATA